jgi:uncharacterized membrane protein YheB (UPF0754 family)
MIGLGKELSKADDDDFKLHRLLGAVFSDKIPLDEKLKVMEEEFNIPMEEDLKEDLNDMCNLSQGIVERTTREVTENVTKTVTENVTKAVTENVTKTVTENVTKEVTKTVTDKLNELNEKLLDDNRMDELVHSRIRNYRINSWSSMVLMRNNLNSLEQPYSMHML